MELSKDLKVFCNYRRLKEIKRCNNFPVVNKEDVAQHSFYVTLLAMVVADEYNQYVASHNSAYHPYDVENLMNVVKIEPLLRKALLHDVEESFTSDIPWNVKHADEETHKVIERAIAKKLEDSYEGSKSMKLYQEIGTRCKDEFEGKFVDICDMLELSQYCFEEVAMGNSYIKPLLDKANRLVKSHVLYEILYTASPLFRSIVDLVSCCEVEVMRQNTEQLLDIC